MKRALLGLALAALLPTAAQAADTDNGVSYNYVEAGYTNADWADGNFDGFSAAGSFSFAEHWYASASYRSVDESDFDINLNETTVNLGWRTPLQANADFIAEVGYVNLGVDIDGIGDDSSDGYRAAVGVRGMLAPKFEAVGKVNYTDITDLNGGEFGVLVGGTWHFNPTWGLTGSYEHTQLLDEDMNIWTVGVRASF